MTSINSYYSGNYYSLSSSSQGQSNASSNTASSASALLSAQSAQGSTLADEATADSAYQLSLSPEAQAYIASLNNSSSSSTSASSSGITLTTQQAQQIKDIVLKYKDAPFTQDTFNQIQDDLQAAGLGADQLAAQQEMSQFNPTSILLDALNGVDTSGEIQSPDQMMSDVDDLANSYMQKVQTLWESVSTTAPTAES